MRKSQWQASFLRVLCRLVSPGMWQSFAVTPEKIVAKKSELRHRGHREHREMQFSVPRSVFSVFSVAKKKSRRKPGLVRTNLNRPITNLLAAPLRAVGQELPERRFRAGRGRPLRLRAPAAA